MTYLDKLIAEHCPDGVPFKTLGEIGTFYGGLSGKSKEDFKDGNAKFITYMNVFSNISLRVDMPETVKIAPNEKQNTIQYGDVLFTGSSETPDECGMSSVLTVHTDEKLYLNSFCFGYRFNDPNLVLPGFSKYLFRSEALRKQIKKTASGVTRFNVSKKKMESVIIPLPPLEVQSEIVRILDNFTELTAELTARQKQYEYYRNLLLTFDDAAETIMTDRQTRLTDLRRAVKWFELQEIANFRNGKGHEKDIVAEGRYIVVNSKFISTSGQVKKFSNKQICPLFTDDILMVMSDLPNGRALAKCYLVEADDRYTLNQRIGALSVRKHDVVDTKYLFYILNRNEQLLRYDNGVDQTNLKKNDILSIRIPIPSMDVQKQIVEVLDRFDAICNDLNIGLPAEIEARQVQYEYYLDKLLTFQKMAS